jgi:hypothetical protein
VLRKPLSPFQAARRQRDLVEQFLAQLGPGASDLALLMVRKAAQLLTMAESARAGALGGMPTDITGLIKIENEARRALRSLGLKVEAPKTPRGLEIARLRWAEEAARKAAEKPDDRTA